MTSSGVEVLVNQEVELIKLTPVEEVVARIAKTRLENVESNKRNKANWKTERTAKDTLVYIIRYLRKRQDFADHQIRKLSPQDLNHVAELIFAERGLRVLFLGWIPVFGWVFAGKYFLFKKRINFLRAFGENKLSSLFDCRAVENALESFYHHFSGGMG